LNKYEGKSFKVKNFHLHENYNPDGKLIYNIALVELTTEIKPEISSHFYTINGICLPKEKIVNNMSEEALFCGWGDTDVNGTKETLFLRKAEYMLKPSQDCPSIRQICNFEDKHKVCYVRNVRFTIE